MKNIAIVNENMTWDAIVADARRTSKIMAAGPDMLEALKAIVEAGRMSDQPRAQYCAAIAAAAIANATGEQP